MSLKVDTKEINIESKKLENLIVKYNENNIEIYSELSKLSSYWNDENGTFFYDKLAKEKDNNFLLTSAIEEFNTFFKEVEGIYGDNTKIEYNDSYKDSVINALNVCYNDLNSCNNILNNTYIPYDFYYKNTLNNTKYNLNENKESLFEYKDNINKYFSEINKKELELSSKINKLEEINISSFEIR